MADLEVSAVIENGCDEYVETILCMMNEFLLLYIERYRWNQ